MSAPISVLLTSVGVPATRGTLYALRRNVDQLPIKAIGIDNHPSTVGRFMVDAFYPVPRFSDPSYLAALLAICEKEQVAVILPQTEEEAALLSTSKTHFSAIGTIIAIASPEALRMASNKWSVAEAFKAQGLPHPTSFLIRGRAELLSAAEALGYPECPFVIKPMSACGGKGVCIVRERRGDIATFLAQRLPLPELSLQEWIRWLEESSTPPELLVQEFLPGVEYSVDAFIGDKLRIAIPRRRNKLLGGTAVETEIELRQDLIDLTLQAGSAWGLRYAFGVQFRCDASGTPKVLECNPRIQGNMVASCFAGANVIWMAVQEALGRHPTAPERPLQQASLYRFWGGIAFGPDWQEEI